MTCNKLFPLIIFAMFSLFSAPILGQAAEVPSTLNYQGTLTDNVGQPFNGTTDMTFKLYTTLSGGTEFWSETQNLTVTNGHFSVVLGSSNPLDTSKFTGVTFIGITVGNKEEMVPRQQLTSVAYAFKAGDAGTVIPSGVIVMWKGSVSNIPEGWALCNGQNGTPDLRDRFVIAAGSNYPVGTPPGGSATKNLAHVHTGPSHTHTGPSHTHSVSGNTDYYNLTTDKVEVGSGEYVASDDYVNHLHSISLTSGASGTGNTGASGTGNTGSAGSNSQDIMPPYFALAFIMKL